MTSAADLSGELAFTTSQTGITATTAIGTKSLRGSYCTFSFISGAMVIGAAVVNIKVEPSAAGRAAAVLRCEGLAQALLQLVGEHARENVGGATGAEWHDDFDRPSRISLR